MGTSRIEGLRGPLALYRATVPGEPAREYPTLVLGHALGVDHTMWDRVLPLLPPGLEVVLWDEPGHGQSDLIEETDDLPHESGASVEWIAVELHMSLKELGFFDDPDGSGIVVAGLSLGGMVSLAFAELYPHDLVALGVFSSGAVLLPHDAWFERAAMVRRDGQAFLADGTMERWFSESFREGDGAAEVAKIREIFLGTSSAGYAQCCHLIAKTDLREDLSKVRVPALLVVGEDDPGMTPSDARKLQRKLNAAEVKVILGAKHMTAVEEPELVAEYLTALVEPA